MDEGEKTGNVIYCSAVEIGETNDTTVEIIASSGPVVAASSYVSDECDHLQKTENAAAAAPSVSIQLSPALENGASGFAPNTSSAETVTSSGVEELQTFLSNFNSELAAESQQHATLRLVESSSVTSAASSSYAIYETTAPAAATLVYEGDAVSSGLAPPTELRIVEFAGSATDREGSAFDGENSVAFGEASREVLLLPELLSHHFQLPSSCHIAVSGGEAMNHGVVVSGDLPETAAQDVQTSVAVANQQAVMQQQPDQQQQQLLIPIDCTNALVNGNQIPPGSTVLLPVIPTVLANGTVEVRIAGQAIALPTTASIPATEGSISSTETLPVIIQQPQHQVFVIVGGAETAVQEAPKKVPISRAKSTKKKESPPKSKASSGSPGAVLVTLQGNDLKGASSSAEEEKDGETETEENEQLSCDAGVTAETTADASQALNGHVTSSVSKPAAGSSKRTLFQCQFCDYTNVKKYLLVRHMKSHSEDRPHFCHVCDKRFKTNNSLQNHVNTHTGFRPYQCQGCDATFTTSGEMVRHIRYKHTQEKPHKCPNCDYASVELSKLKRHLRSHTGERPYQCRKCSYASPDMYKLKRHMRVHTGEKPYECDICLQRFTQSNSLKAHKMIHTGNKPVYQCEFCSSSCGRKTDLKIHIQKLHTTSDSPLVCRKCGKAYPDRYSLKQHLRAHEGERSFSCTLCNYSAFTQRHLDVHMMVHRCEKPHECPIPSCTHAFRQRTALKRHMETKHGSSAELQISDASGEQTTASFHCGECGKRFRKKEALLKHGERHRLATNGLPSNVSQVLPSSRAEETSSHCQKQTVSIGSIESEHEESEGEEVETQLDKSAGSIRLYKCAHCDESFRQFVQLEHHCQLEHIAADDIINSANIIYVPNLALGESSSRKSTDAASIITSADDGEKADAASNHVLGLYDLDTKSYISGESAGRRRKRVSEGEAENVKLVRTKRRERPLNRLAARRNRMESATTATTSAAAAVAKDLEQQRRKEVENCFGFADMDTDEAGNEDMQQRGGAASEAGVLPMEISDSAQSDGTQQTQYVSMQALLAATGFDAADDSDSGDEETNRVAKAEPHESASA